CLRNQRGKIGGAFLDGLYVVVQVIHLTAAQQFAQQRFLDNGVLLLHDKGAHGQPTGGWRGNDRQVAHARHSHVQGARNRRGGQREDVDFTAERLQLFLLANAKAVFLVDDDQAEIGELDVILQQFVGADK